jgi:putative hydrolase of the HAD superfamily
MNVVFDLGGVLVAWDPDAIAERAFPDRQEADRVKRDVLRHADWLEADRGLLSFDALIDRAAARTSLTVESIRMLIDTVPTTMIAVQPMVEMLYRVKRAGHHAYCLSNMPSETLGYLRRTHSFWDAFSGCVISCEVGHCKPESAIYEYLLRTCGLDAAETLFIDDMLVNVEAAAKLGIRPLHFKDPARTEAALILMGVLDG